MNTVSRSRGALLRVQTGLREICGEADSDQKFERAVDEETPMQEHPFGFSIPLRGKGSGVVLFVGYPGHTRSSVDAMLAHVLMCVKHHDPTGEERLYLRIILGEAQAKGTEQYYVYFEIGCEYGVYICGGCTDFSGGGKAGTERLENVFALLSFVYNTPVSRTIIRYWDAEPIRRKIEAAYDSIRRDS
ncbi:MAG: hypothetical protein G01um101448_732 [Parcubacteria group bacterium Gr01-1014_48]|nr:MAG: hypothetical protein Greene041614_174 [Parcubacteria group bacterium Greene0416_14]TSC73489.1 MAG: hypothetical protein G01um101448_732 [Parcubacteria group bacterium Gr01-1014_48]TSD01222.1 MAG: hypothetical protein Greene101415_417 [Parcubacteria group bacterium Greene1014_15]TSD08313.1 MAG: hypothetical protein Greene07144_199 [Parcubacteria group bacterium Greene0714_4]